MLNSRKRRRSRSAQRDEAGVGEDSFLDTTANLVGILIILVVIVGAKTKLEAEEYGRQQAQAEHDEDLAEPRRQAAATYKSLLKQQQDLQSHEAELRYRQQERKQLLTKVALAREKVELAEQQLDDQAQSVLETSKEIRELQQKLADVKQQADVDDDQERPQVILEHLPTPMARTVFTKEMHVQLKGGQVTVIPWDRLVEALKSQIPLAARRKASQDNLEDALGPVGGFLMRYRMNAVPGGLELDHFELEATPAAVQESLPEALAAGGRLRLELASRDPSETVITMWVYPDSFEEFRQLKARLFEAGFLAAARPLPEGVRIGASPRGTRSAAQ